MTHGLSHMIPNKKNMEITCFQTTRYYSNTKTMSILTPQRKKTIPLTSVWQLIVEFSFQPESKPLAQFEEHSNNCRGADAEVLGIKLIIASVSTKRLRFWAAFHGWKSWLEACSWLENPPFSIGNTSTQSGSMDSITMLVYRSRSVSKILLSRCLFYMGRTSEPRVKYHL